MAHDVLSRQSLCIRLFLFVLLLTVPGTPPAWAQTAYGFVPNGEPVNSLTIFDASTHTVVGTMTGSINQARSVAISPDGRRVYVLNAGVNTISVFDTVTRTEITGSPIATGGVWPWDMQITPDGKKGFIVHSGGTITVLDLTTNTLVGSPLNPGNGDSLVQMKMTPDGSKAYVTATSSGRIWVVDVATNAITGFLEPIAGNYPMNGLALSPDGQTAWITSLTNNAVRAIDLATDTASGVISVGTTPTGGIAVSPDGLFVYVTNKGSDNVSVIDTATKTVVQTIAVGVGPESVDFTADGTLAYVVNNWHDTVSVIDTSTRTVIDTLTGFHTPFTEGGHFIGPLVMAPGAPASITSDADLTALGFGSLVPLQGGTIQLGGAWTTTRTFSLQGTGGTLDTNGFAAVINGDLIDDGTLTKTGAGMLTLGGSNTHTGGTVVAGGVLSVVGTHPVPITVNGGTLGGNGTVGDVVATSGAVAPGNSPGILHATDVTLNAGSSLDIQIDGVTPGTGYDQLLVSGTTTINGASLNIISSVTPPDSALFTIATNVSGVFAGMPQGAAVMLGSRLFRLSYVGGDGNDLVLIADMPPSLAALSGHNMDEDSAALSIPISVGDDWTDVNVLTVQATSLDTSLVPPSHLAITGTGSSRTLAVTPAANASGTTTITVSVSDGTFTTDRTFQLTVNAVNDAPTIGTIAAQSIAANHALAAVGFTIDDIDNDANGLTVSAVSSNPALVPDANLTIGGSGSARTVAATPITDASGSTLITVTVSDGVASASTSFTLIVTPAPPTPPTPPTPLTYALAEGATGAFFDTDILLANPNATPANIEVRFLLPDGASIIQNRTLLATSRATIQADDVPGLEATAFSTIVTSLDGLPLVVERTMRWDRSGYGASSEKASSGTATTWYFAEGAQGFFSTFLLLANPATVDNVAHITWLREQEPALERTYQLPASSRTTIDAGSDPELVGRAFGARIVFDTPGMAERAMYFGTDPLWEGGAAAAGATELSTHWFLAEGATGTFFTTFVLLANPNDTPVDITLTYFPEGGTPVVRHETIAAKARMTRNIALDDPTLLSAAVATQVDASLPIVVERAQYWGQPTWIESHGSLGVTAAGLKWGLAEGRVGGADQAQTYILLANPGGNDASVTLTFLRTDGTTLTKSVTVPAASRFTVGLTGAQSLVPELIDESFGTVIESTQPIVVERSLYSNANGVIWAAGTNATGTPLP